MLPEYKELEDENEKMQIAKRRLRPASDRREYAKGGNFLTI